jgi:hypothetical protein
LICKNDVAKNINSIIFIYADDSTGELMCRFIALAVKEKQPVYEALSGYFLSDNTNTTLVNAVPGGYTWLWITDGHCSCGFYTPILDIDKEITKIRKKYSKPKYRKKGWNEKRINEKIEGIKKKCRSSGLSEPLYKALRNYLITHRKCFFFIGWISGDPNEEPFSITGVENFEISGESFNQSDIKENLLYRMI